MLRLNYDLIMLLPLHIFSEICMRVGNLCQILWPLVWISPLQENHDAYRHHHRYRGNLQLEGDSVPVYIKHD